MISLCIYIEKINYIGQYNQSKFFTGYDEYPCGIGPYEKDLAIHYSL